MRRFAALTLSGILLAGCGNAVTADVNGVTAVAVNDQGKPVVLALVCHSTIDQVTIDADREGLTETEENKLLGTWTADEPMKGLVTLDVGAPGAGWGAEPAFVPEARKGYIVIASQAKADVETSQVYFHGSDLTSLAPDEVLVGEAEIQKRAKFEKSCAQMQPADDY